MFKYVNGILLECYPLQSCLDMAVPFILHLSNKMVSRDECSLTEVCAHRKQHLIPPPLTVPSEGTGSKWPGEL